MEHLASTSASTSSSGASSSTPAPATHGLRSQLSHLLPKHALFEVRLEMERLSNVPLIEGEFGVRWKFKSGELGCGVLGKMKGGSRTWSGQGKGKTKAVAGLRSASYLRRMVAPTTKPKIPPRTTQTPIRPTRPTTTTTRAALSSPSAPPTALRPISTIRTPPISRSRAPHHVVQTTSELTHSKAHWIAPWMPLQNYNVKWTHSVNFAVHLDVNRETGNLIPEELTLVVMQVCISSLSLRHTLMALY